MFRHALLLACGASLLTSDAQTPAVVKPAFATETVAADPDDPAIWVHPKQPQNSLIFGTDKTAAPQGALYAFDLKGKVKQIITGLDRPNNVDVETGLLLNGKPTDIAVVTERLQKRLRIFSIAPDSGKLTDVTAPGGTTVFADAAGEQAAPMGIGLYRRTKDGAIFAIVSRKEGPREGYLHQYRLTDDGTGKVKASFVRRLGNFSGTNEIEAVAVDDALGYVYYADEGDGIHKWRADPDHPDAATELARFGTDGFTGDREGIALYTHPDGTGYLICTEQLPDRSIYHLYPRGGRPGNPHDHSHRIKSIQGSADDTDGLEAVSTPLGPDFPQGLVIAMNSRPRNFLVFRWQDFATTGEPRLPVFTRTKKGKTQ